MCIACSVASAGTVYKWVDENGVTHYSDQPHENAAKVDLPQAQTYVAPPAPRQSAAAASSSPPAPPETGYTACSIAVPSPDQVIFNTFTVQVRLDVHPAQHPDDRIVLALDGKPLTNLPSRGSQFSISPVSRGSHSVQATIQDPNGKTVCQSPSVTFHVRQASLNTRPKS